MYEELGYTDTSEVKDRFYFHSMYVRSPGGVLVECTANVPGGFYVDELPEELGTHLNLPPWYEDQRDVILGQLEPVTVPEANRPKAGVTRHQAAGGAGAPGPDRAVADQRGVLQATLSRRNGINAGSRFLAAIEALRCLTLSQPGTYTCCGYRIIFRPANARAASPGQP